MKQNNNICIIGYGRLGRTLAGILQAHFDIHILETDTKRSEHAKQQGFSLVSESELDSMDAIILCVPISSFESTVKNIGPYISPGTVVMDTCSVKVLPAQIMAAELPDSVDIIATHPLFGPDSVSRGLNKLAIITHPVRVSESTFVSWGSFWRQLGLNVINASPEEHDEAAAYTLGMTHFFGRIMGELELKPQAITTVGYNALYEVMIQTNNDSWELFRDMQRFNPYAKQMRERVYRAIESVEAKLDEAIEP